jgi:hypothetical protein
MLHAHKNRAIDAALHKSQPFLLVDHPKVWRESSPQGLSPI